MEKEYKFKPRELGALAMVVSALFIIVFFLGVTVGEHHERAKQVKSKASQIHIKTPSNPPYPPPLKSHATQEKAAFPHKAPTTYVKKGFYVQVGAFLKKEGALKWKKELRNKGFDAICLPPGPRGFYRVVLGPYDSKDLALRVARKVDKIFKVRSSVVQGRNIP